MRSIGFAAAVLCFAVLTGCSGSTNTVDIAGLDKTIKIAVLKNSGSQQSYFEKGIERAYNDVIEEYKDSSFKIECEFYDNNETYETVDAITEELAADRHLTAIIGSDAAAISENQLYITEKNGKILINPGQMNTEKLPSENEMFFYMSYTGFDTGELMKKISKTLPDMNWAVCAASDSISRDEMTVFITADSTNVVDYCSIEELSVYFDRVVERWKNLDVQGVILLPNYDEGFELLYRLKEKMPDIYVITDSDMDSQKEYNEHKQFFNNLYIADNFAVDKSDDAYTTYTEENGKFEDTWETHGYNTFRMIVDTAVQNDTASSVKIAGIIRAEGYKGKGENFIFSKNGVLIPKEYTYIEMGSLKEYKLPAK